MNLRTRKTESGKDYSAINEKGSVPLLVLDNGETITECAVIVQYLADQKPESDLAPRPGTMERVRVNEWLNFVATDLHKNFTPFFMGLGDDALAHFRKQLERKIGYVAKKLGGREYLTGHRFTIADTYLYTVLTWANLIKFDLSPWPVVVEYMKRVTSRPKVQQAMAAEGLTKKAA